VQRLFQWWFKLSLRRLARVVEAPKLAAATPG
jgi:hypothetical protein